MSTLIMGQAQAAIEQMRSYIQKVNPKVHLSVVKMIPYYLTEGEKEGVRGDIAFAQSCLETGNFTFKGSAVTLDQNNFCGMGVTSNGMKGNSFSSPQLGIRAQIQHLKAYATSEPLKGSCADPRYQYVKKGSAPYVEWLGIQENPSGSGWAAGKDYGSKILNILDQILKINQKGEDKMEIKQKLTTKNCYVGQNNPAYVVVHETDNWSNGAGAKTHANAMYNGNLAGTVHYYVDDTDIYQTLDHKNGAYAVGDGGGKYGITNRNSINIEICVNPDSNYYTAVKNCQWLCAHLLEQYGWGTDRLKRHYDASRKHCPRRILDEGLWDDFVKNVQNIMKGESVEESQENLQYGSQGKAVQKCQENLMYLGFDLGESGADGSYGNATVAAVKTAQGKYGLTQDGIYGPNTKTKVESEVARKKQQEESAKENAKERLIKDGQIHCNNYVNAGLAVDGDVGPATRKAYIKCVQQAMNMDYGKSIAVDGIWGSASDNKLAGHTVRYGETQEMVRALQIGLMLHGYNPNGVDGNFGTGCQQAVREYQADHGLTVDGIAGYNTFKSLL